jgi:hypothetical protein
LVIFHWALDIKKIKNVFHGDERSDPFEGSERLMGSENFPEDDSHQKKRIYCWKQGMFK